MAFDVDAATAQYVDGLGPEILDKAAAYTTGNHWLLLWGLVVTGIVTWIFVRTGILTKIEARFQQRGRALRTFLVCAAYMLLAPLISLPWTLYTDWWRQTAYGRSSQPLGDFLAQGAIGLLISALLGSLFFMAVYALIRRTGKWWWLWSGGLTAVAISALLLISPVLIQPIFNKFEPVPEGEVRHVLLEMAYAAGIPTDHIFVYDGSRQSNNFTANVSGIGSSARIAISDVAFTNATLDEVKAVTAHEMGHYILGHIWRSVAVYSVLAMLIFFLAARLFPLVAKRFGSTATIADPVGLPVLLLIVSFLGLLAQPVTNGLTRIGEIEADQYSLETVDLPDALAGALIKTAEYRNPRPHPLEEFLFYTHPSVERRVRMAMEWKATRGDG